MNNLSSSQAGNRRAKKVAERSEIDERFKWDISIIFDDDRQFEDGLADMGERIRVLGGYKGNWNASADTMLEFLNFRNDVLMRFERLLSYARLNQDEDTRVSKYRGYYTRTTDLWGKIREALSWFSPELLAMPWETLEEWMAGSDALKIYRHYLEDEFRIKDHVLSKEGEHLISLSSNIGGDPSQVFHAFNDADVGKLFPTVLDDEGNEVQLTHSRYGAFLEQGSPRLRRDTFEGFYGTYSNFTITMAALLKAEVDKDIFYARARKYDSALEYALSGDNVPVEVYTNLIEAVHRGLPALHEYIAIRKKALGLDEIHLYDMHAPLFPEAADEYGYRDAQEIVLKSLSPLGEDYIDNVRTAFGSRWIDVYENAGKANGAYSWGIFSVHPFLLLNYNDTLNDVFTLAHELGHSMHTHYTISSQPFIYGDYSIFVAEVASTFNEALLIDHLLNTTDDKRKKINLLAQYITNFNGTLFAQTLFAEFELKMHQMAEAGEPLTADSLSALYSELARKYYGKAMTYDDMYAFTWCRIPHFYRNFYVYKYATSFAAATALSQKLLKREEGAAEAYKEFLSGGSSDYPINLLKKAGVNMSEPEPVVKALGLYAELVKRLEELV